MSLIRRAWELDYESGTLPGLAFHIDAALQDANDEAVYDVHAQTGAAAAHSRGKEGVKHPGFDLDRHAYAIVGHGQARPVLSGAVRGDFDFAAVPALEGVNQSVHQQIGQHLTIGPGVTVADNPRRQFCDKTDGGFAETRL